MPTPRDFIQLHRPYHSIAHYDLFSVYAAETFPHQFEWNFFQLHFVPTAEEMPYLEEIFEDYMIDFHWNTYHFNLPTNRGTHNLQSYLEMKHYGIAVQQMMTIHPQHFSTKKANTAITICPLTSENAIQYRDFHWQFDRHHGEAFAHDRAKYTTEHLFEPSSPVQIIGAWLDGALVATLNMITYSDAIEIDRLTVREDKRHIGIATALQNKVMTIAKKAALPVILVVDANSTVQEMYHRQGYQFGDFQVQLIKQTD